MQDNSPHLSDPRTCQPEKTTLEETLLDLDECERIKAKEIARRFARAYRKSKHFDESYLPTLWSSAHDCAIAEVAEMRKGCRQDAAGRKT